MERDHKTVPTATNMAYGMVSHDRQQQKQSGGEEGVYEMVNRSQPSSSPATATTDDPAYAVIADPKNTFNYALVCDMHVNLEDIRTCCKCRDRDIMIYNMSISQENILGIAECPNKAHRDVSYYSQGTSWLGCI